MSYIQILSTFLELVIAGIGILIAQGKKGQIYGWFIALTFGLYVVFDLSRILEITVDASLLDSVFFVATVSALIAVYLIKNSKKK